MFDFNFKKYTATSYPTTVNPSPTFNPNANPSISIFPSSNPTIEPTLYHTLEPAFISTNTPSTIRTNEQTHIPTILYKYNSMTDITASIPSAEAQATLSDYVCSILAYLTGSCIE